MGHYGAIDESPPLVEHSRFNKRAEKEIRTIRREIKGCAPLIIILTACVLVSYYAYFIPIRKQFEQEGYDYIIVGAGPSGIITAVSLAQKLQKEARILNRPYHGKVLLLESGTRSQSSVEEMVQQSEKNRPKNKNISTSKKRARSEDSSLLDEFDVPLLWSDCNSQGVGKEGMMQYLTHHWPADNAIIGRAIGGSGIHNAM